MLGLWRRERIYLAYALLAAATGVAFGLLAQLLGDVQTLPSLAHGRIVQLLPIPLFEWGIRTLGGWAKLVLFLTLLLVEATVLALAGWLWLRRRWRRPSLTLFALFGCLCSLAVVVLMPRMGVGPFGTLSPGGSLRATLGALLTYGVWAVGLYGATRIAGARYRSDAGRRRVVLVGGAWTALVLLGIGGGVWTLLRRTTLTRLGLGPSRTTEVTPTEDFYLVSKNVIDPTVDAGAWRLRVEGNVERPLAFSLDDLRALPVTEQWATMECISNPVGGNLMGNARWRGVKLSELLARAGVREGAVDLVTECADGYTESLPLDRAMSPEVLLVYEMNGEPLTPKHGAPARLQVPGLYGLKSSKWVQTMHVVNEDYLGYWQRQSNWTDGGAVYTECRVDYPPDGVVARDGMLLTGVAYTGLRGVSRVEVSVDDGETWAEATLDPPLGPLTWRLWSYSWRPVGSGFHTVKARAYDNAGNAQEESSTTRAPGQVPMEGVIVTGHAGIHSLNLTVREN